MTNPPRVFPANLKPGSWGAAGGVSKWCASPGFPADAHERQLTRTDYGQMRDQGFDFLTVDSHASSFVSLTW